MDQNLVVGLAVAGAVLVGSIIFLSGSKDPKDKKAGETDQKLAAGAKSSSSSSSAISTSASSLSKADAAKSAPNKYPNGKMSIYFGSQTGTAENYSRSFMDEAKAKGFDAKVIDLEEFNVDILAATKLVVFMRPSPMARAIPLTTPPSSRFGSTAIPSPTAFLRT